MCIIQVLYFFSRLNYCIIGCDVKRFIFRVLFILVKRFLYRSVCLLSLVIYVTVQYLNEYDDT
jgi:hypothetical protein